MNKVIIIHLNGIAYHVEEDGYEALRAYLDVAHRKLEGNPDRDEIIADIEQSIADKFRALLNPHKTVVLTAEVREVLEAMGPVQGEAAADAAPNAAPGAGTPGPAAAAPAGTASAPKRLFRLREGAMIGGVCNGLAAYLGADVTLIRVIFALVGITFGAGVLLYLAMMIIIPYADSAADVDAAHGDPSTTDEIIRRAKQGYYESLRSIRDPFTRRKWRRQFKREMRQHRRDLRDNLRRSLRGWRMYWHTEVPTPPPAGAGWWFAYPFIAVVNVAVVALCIGAVLSLVLTGSVFGVYLPATYPFWLQILIVILVCRLLAWPMSFMHQGYYGHRWGYHDPISHLLHTLAWFAVLVFGVWFLDHHTRHGHELVMRCKYELEEFAAQVRDWWAHL
jgi:phage shock protein PspC (stress-responsive transcriptional regulator)